MIAIVRSLDRFDGRSSFGTWVYRIATNASLDELRRRKRRAVPTSDDGDDEHPSTRSPTPTAAGASRPSAIAWRSTLHSGRSATTSAFPSCCATSPTSTTPRSPRCSTSLSARSRAGSPEVEQRWPRRCPQRAPGTNRPIQNVQESTMNDEDLPINAELASAYLDGELDATERARGSRRSRRHGAGRLVHPSARRARRRRSRSSTAPRTAAMAAALAEFDALRSPRRCRTPSDAATVTSLSSRRIAPTGCSPGSLLPRSSVSLRSPRSTPNAGDDDNATSAVEVSASPTERVARASRSPPMRQAQRPPRRPLPPTAAAGAAGAGLGDHDCGLARDRQCRGADGIRDSRHQPNLRHAGSAARRDNSTR